MSRTTTALRRSFFINLLIMVSAVLLLQACGGGKKAAAPSPVVSVFAYVANTGTNDISAYTLNTSTGALTPIDVDAVTSGIQNFAAGTGPISVTVDPSSKFAYVANAGSNDISAYTIQPTTGALTPIDADPVTAGIQNFAAGTNPQFVITTRTIR